MTRPRTIPLVTLIALAGAAALMPIASTASHGAGAQKDALVAVYDGRYVAGGRTYESLDALEADVRSARPASLLVVSCAPAATRSWLAAVPRFEDIPLHLDVAGDPSPSCPAVPMQAAGVTSAQPDPAVHEYWARRMP